MEIVQKTNIITAGCTYHTMKERLHTSVYENWELWGRVLRECVSHFPPRHQEIFPGTYIIT